MGGGTRAWRLFPWGLISFARPGTTAVSASSAARRAEASSERGLSSFDPACRVGGACRRIRRESAACGRG